MIEWIKEYWTKIIMVVGIALFTFNILGLHSAHYTEITGRKLGVTLGVILFIAGFMIARNKKGKNN